MGQIKNKIGIALLAACVSMVGAAPKNILHYYKVGGFKHSDGIIGGTNALNQLAQEHGFTVKHSENHNDLVDLDQYDLIVYNNNVGGDGATTSDQAKQNVMNYMLNGGKMLGWHGASDHHGSWKWYEDELYSGTKFQGHGGGQFTVTRDPEGIADPEISKMWEENNLGNFAVFDTEKYYFNNNIRGKEGVTIVQLLEGSNGMNQMNGDHFFGWVKEVGDKGGKLFYTALGHAQKDFQQSDGWLVGASWAFMKYLDGDYAAPVQGCKDESATNYNEAAAEACADCCTYAPCCKTEGYEEYDADCKNPVAEQCSTVGVSKIPFNQSHLIIGSSLIEVAYANPYQIEIVNVSGETVLAENASGNNQYELSGYQPGIYFINVTAAGKSHQRRIMIK